MSQNNHNQPHGSFQMRDRMKNNKIQIKELLDSFDLKLDLSENILNYRILDNDYIYEKTEEKFLIGQYVKDFYNPEWGEEKEFDCHCFESDTSVIWLMPDYELAFVYLRRPSRDSEGFTIGFNNKCSPIFEA